MSKEIERVKSMKNKELEDYEALVLARKHIDHILEKRKTLLDGEKSGGREDTIVNENLQDQHSKPSRVICKTGVCTYGEPVEYCERYNCKCYNFEKAQREDIHRKTMIDEHSREDEFLPGSI